MMTRREVLAMMAAVPAARWLSVQGDSKPALAPGAPQSPERTALIDAFKRRSDGIDKLFEARTHKSDFVMPYRLFKPNAPGRLPLVVYLHGSGGLGDDNLKQMGLGNIFGTRVWALPENQKEFPCYVLAPQTDRGWVKYAPVKAGEARSETIPGLGDGARVAFEVIDALRRELPIDDRRIYITGQSMGGAGVWHMIAQRRSLFAAAVVCCGSASSDNAADAVTTPLWNFHGDADATVPIAVSRQRLSALRKAGGQPISTEYADVGHNSWEWAYTEPALVRWAFAHRRPA